MEGRLDVGRSTKMPFKAGQSLTGLLTSVAWTLALGACATAPAEGPNGVDLAVSDTQEGIGDAVLTPFSDLNLRRAPIPPKLAEIVSPYEPIEDSSCDGLANEVSQLTAILGADIDAPDEGADPDLSQRAGEGAADLALDQVASAVTGFIPYRSILREASGASSHERRLREVYDRGAQRRAYLKGIGASKGCAPPAAPDPRAGIVAEGTPIEYRGEN